MPVGVIGCPSAHRRHATFELRVCSWIHLSRNTVRRTLHTLSTLGLMQLRRGAQGGAFINEGGGAAISLGVQDISALGMISPAHLAEARATIRTNVARLACQRCTVKDLITIEKSIGDCASAIRENVDFERRARINYEFHFLLARATRNPLLVVLANAVVERNQPLAMRYGPTTSPALLRFRRRMLEHLRRRDDETAATEREKYLKGLEKCSIARS